jgi:uncharacterized membrane protein
MLISGAVAALVTAATIGLLDSGYRGPRERARKAIIRYADMAQRRIRGRRLSDRLPEPGFGAVLALLGVGLAAAVVTSAVRRRRSGAFSEVTEGHGQRRLESIEKVIEVDRPLRMVYDQWTQFEEFPLFMSGVKEVRQLDDSHLLWRADVLGKEKSWEAEITEQEPDTRISWKSVAGASNAGTVRFESLGPERTRVRLTMAYEPEGVVENVGDALGALRLQVERSVRDFKGFIEGRTSETGAWRGRVEDSVPRPGSH